MSTIFGVIIWAAWAVAAYVLYRRLLWRAGWTRGDRRWAVVVSLAAGPIAALLWTACLFLQWQ